MKLVHLSVPLVALALSASAAEAQNFFERLFGIAPAPRQAPPAYNYPPPPGPGLDAPPVDDAPRRATTPAAPVVARPMSIRAPSDDSVVGKELKQNGSNGSLKLERAGRDFRVRLTLVGRKSAASPDTCAVQLDNGNPIPLNATGRPDGATRLQMSDATCPLQLDLLDEAVLVKGPDAVCTFQSAGATCEVDPNGLWGPEPRQLMSRVRDYEAQRAASDRVVRENYKVLAQRARPETMRAVVAEQAAFSAEREMACRNYAREGATSFCNAKFTESRALALATRLGLATSSTASVETPRPRRRTSEPYALPSTDELIQRRPED